MARCRAKKMYCPIWVLVAHDFLGKKKPFYLGMAFNK
jgi:hypothetical protein